MLPLVEFPEIVQHYAPHFESVFSAEAYVQFQRYLSGLIISENKTVDGINRLFVIEKRNQSSLNRLLTESPFSVQALNQARLGLLDSLPGTQMKPKGVLSVDNTLLIHYGHHFENIAYLYDPTEERYVWAHDLVNLHKLQRHLKFELDGSAPFWRRITQAQSLWSLACFIAAGLAQGRPLHDVMAPLLATLCY